MMRTLLRTSHCPSNLPSLPLLATRLFVTPPPWRRQALYPSPPLSLSLPFPSIRPPMSASSPLLLPVSPLSITDVRSSRPLRRPFSHLRHPRCLHHHLRAQFATESHLFYGVCISSAHLLSTVSSQDVRLRTTNTVQPRRVSLTSCLTHQVRIPLVHACLQNK